jgi:hypothetical protein
VLLAGAVISRGDYRLTADSRSPGARVVAPVGTPAPDRGGTPSVYIRINRTVVR